MEERNFWEQFINENLLPMYSLSTSLLNLQPQISKLGVESDIVVLFNAQPFINFLKRLQVVSGKALSAAKSKQLKVKEPEIEKELPRDVSRVGEMSLDLLNKCANTTINASTPALTAWTLWGLTRSYIDQAYPGKFQVFEEILDLEPVFVPDIEPESARGAYTIYGYPNLATSYKFRARQVEEHGIRFDYIDFIIPNLPDSGACESEFSYVSRSYSPGRKGCPQCNYPLCLERLSSLGECLCALNLIIWEAFRSRPLESSYKLGLILEGVPDLQQKYREQVEESLQGYKKIRACKDRKAGV